MLRRFSFPLAVLQCTLRRRRERGEEKVLECDFFLITSHFRLLELEEGGPGRGARARARYSSLNTRKASHGSAVSVETRVLLF